MPAWRIEKTRSNIESRFGPSQLELGRASIASVTDRQYHARYHYQEVLRLLKRFARTHLSDQPLIAVVLGEGEDRTKFEILMLKIGAHAVACVQGVHSVPDLLAHAIYFSLGLNLQPSPLPERDVSAHSVIRLLSQCPDHHTLRDTLSQLCSDRSFKHVAALSNKAKHQGIVKPTLNEDWTGKRKNKHEIRFKAFKHSGKPFPEMRIEDVLSPAYAMASKVVVDAGNEINRLYEANSV